MNNVIYERTISPGKQAPDGETSTDIVVTEEHNGFAVFRQDYDGTTLIRWFPDGGYNRTLAIELGVETAMMKLYGVKP